MFERIASLTLGNRPFVALALLLGFSVATFGAVFIEIDLSFTEFFGREDPANTAYQDFRDHWGADDDTMIVVAHGAGEDLLVPTRMEALAALADALEALPEIRNVTSVVSAPLVVGEAPGILDMDPVFDSMPSERGPEWQAWRDRVIDSRLLVPSLVAPDGTHAALVVEAKYETSDVQQIRPIVAAVQAVLDERAEATGLYFGIAGIPPVRAAFFDQFMRDQLLFVPLGMLFISGCLYFVFRRIHGVLVPGLAAGLPVAMVFGIMGWTGEPVGLLSQTFTTLLPAIAVADAIHMVSRFHEALRRRVPPGTEPTAEHREAAVREAAEKIGAACLLTSVTTGIGFLSLSVAQMPILQSFGLYAAIGIGLAYLGVLLFVPLLLTRTRGSIPPAGRLDDPTPGDRFLLACADFSIERPWVVIGTTAAVIAASLWFGRLVIVDNNLTQALQSTHPVTAANIAADAELGGIIGLEIDLRGEPDALKNPRLLAAMLDFEEWALAQPEIRQVVSPATWTALLHQAITGEYRAPESREAAAQFYLLAEGDPSFTRSIDADYARARMLISMRDQGGLEFIERTAQIETELQRRLAELPIEASMTGTPFVAYRGINNVTHDLRNSLALAFVLITIIIGLLFRDLRTGLLCLIPNALPLLVGYGLLGVMGWMLDPTPAVIFTVALGIAVDDTLHLMIRTREELARGIGKNAAIRQAVLHSGRAVAITSTILIFGFGVNALSSFKATQILGYLGATVIFTALLCDLFVLPALLAVWGREPVTVEPAL